MINTAQHCQAVNTIDTEFELQIKLYNIDTDTIASISISNQKRNLGRFNRIIVTSVSSVLNKIKDKMNGF